jgi:hypothetical protein
MQPKCGWCDYLHISHLTRDNAGNDAEQDDEIETEECVDYPGVLCPDGNFLSASVLYK